MLLVCICLWERAVLLAFEHQGFFILFFRLADLESFWIHRQIGNGTRTASGQGQKEPRQTFVFRHLSLDLHMSINGGVGSGKNCCTLLYFAALAALPNVDRPGPRQPRVVRVVWVVWVVMGSRGRRL